MDIETLSTESKYVIDNFIGNFTKYKDKSIALYGIGINTKNILDNIEGFNILGLMDAENVGKYFFGKKVLSYEEVIKNVDMIVIIARQSIVSIIYKRIEFLEKEYGIPIYTVDGNFITNKNKEFIVDDIDYWKTNKEQLIDKIDENEIISFDVFDTLIMRKTLQPQNIFEIVERRIYEENSLKLDFKNIRVQCERELNEKIEAPKFDEIYKELKNKLNIDDDLLEEIKKIEIETELNCIIPRHEMVNIYKYALDNNKKVYLLSDMYFSCEVLEIFLKKCKIYGYEKLMVSSDYGKSKASGKMFEYYAKLNNNKKMLHIGDNPRVDIKMAKLYNIDTFHIFSSYELFMHSSFKELLVDTSNIDNNIILGLFASSIFNDPFILNSTKGVLHIDDIYQMGYLFIGPLILKFTLWFINKVKNADYSKILFCARDGYLIKEVYDLMVDTLNIDMNTESIYFKTSRRAATVPTIENENDIEFILKRLFKGTKGQLLKSRFGVKAYLEDHESEELVTVASDYEELRKYIFSYKDEIISNAKDEANAYKNYLKHIKVNDSDNICVFDFVSSGTIQYYISKFLNKSIDGLYFASNSIPNRFYNDFRYIDSLFGNINEFNINNNLQRYYFFIESILTDENNTLIKYEKDSTFIYENYKKSNRDFLKVSKAHDGIRAFIKDTLSVDNNIISYNIDNKLVDEILGLLMSNKCIVDINIKKAFYNENGYDCETEDCVWPS